MPEKTIEEIEVELRELEELIAKPREQSHAYHASTLRQANRRRAMLIWEWRRLVGAKSEK